MQYGKKIGKGSYTTCYQDPNDPNSVLLVSNDPMKEALSEVEGCDHFVPTERVVYDNPSVYRQPKLVFKQAVLPRLNDHNVALYRALRKVYLNNNLCNYTEIYNKVSKLKDRFPLFWEEFEHVLNWSANYSYDLRFEILPRNVSTTPDGRLLLVDCFYIPK